MLSFPSTARKMKFSMKDFFSKCSQIHRKLWIWSNLLKEFLMGNFISCSVMLMMYVMYSELFHCI